MNRVEVLDQAREAITRDRAATHGKAEDSFQRIADFWTVWLGDRLDGEITAFDVAQMMVLFKLARARGNPGHLDNITDQVGYAALSVEMVGQLGGTEWTPPPRPADVFGSVPNMIVQVDGLPPPMTEACIKSDCQQWSADCLCPRCVFFESMRRKG